MSGGEPPLQGPAPGPAPLATPAAAPGRPAGPQWPAPVPSRCGSAAHAVVPRTGSGATACRPMARTGPVRAGLLLAALLLALPAAVPAAAQQPVLPGLSSQDRKAPIEITADQLVVEQSERTATFKGEVEAVQGTMRLTADRLVVHYGQDQPRTDVDPAAEGGSIRRIEAFGRVLVRAPGETAEGERGVYDVTAGTLSLEGSVVLTRAGNVVRGERLEVDLASGRSTLLAAPGQGPAGRVRALFVPGGGKGS